MRAIIATSIAAASFITGGLSYAVFSIAARPPVMTYISFAATQNSAKPGDKVPFAVTAIWNTQCPATIYPIWTDAATGNLVYRNKPHIGGIADAGAEVKRRYYPQDIPSFDQYGHALPDRICLQAQHVHTCGWPHSTTLSPKACINIEK